MVLDSGDGVSHAVPVYEGYAMPNAIKRIDLAGRDVTHHFQMLLRKAGYPFHTSAERDLVRMIKERTCYLSLSPQKEEKESHLKSESFTLPDGQVIKVIFFHFHSRLLDCLICFY